MMTSIENQALTNQMIQTMMANQSTGQGGKDLGIMTMESRYLRDLQRHKPPSFDGGKVNSIAAENWLEAIETAFHFMNCPPKYVVHCGTYMLKGEAHFWWKGAQKTIIPQGEFITWCQFKDAYLHKYYPITARVKMQTTFLALKQGDRSVEEYDLEFNRLARFSQAYVSSEKLKGERFIAGLREELRGNVASESSFVYAKALQVATLLDTSRTDKLQLGIAQSCHIAAQGKVTDSSHPRTGRPSCGHTDKRRRAQYGT